MTSESAGCPKNFRRFFVYNALPLHYRRSFRYSRLMNATRLRNLACEYQMRIKTYLLWCAAILLVAVNPYTTLAVAPYPDSTFLEGITWDFSSHVERAPGSDNWPVTWADDGHQYT